MGWLLSRILNEQPSGHANGERPAPKQEHLISLGKGLGECFYFC